MFDDLIYLIEKAEIPEVTKIALAVITKGVSWFPWVFVAIGLLLNKEYFIYWLVFFMVIQGAMILTLCYILISIVRYTHQIDIRTKNVKSSEGLVQKSIDGIIGNAAWILFLLTGFIIFKLSGIADNLTNSIFNR